MGRSADPLYGTSSPVANFSSIRAASCWLRYCDAFAPMCDPLVGIHYLHGLPSSSLVFLTPATWGEASVFILPECKSMDLKECLLPPRCKEI